MKKNIISLLILFIVITLSACQQNTLSEISPTPTMKVLVSPSATETSIPLPTPTLVTLFPTSTPTPYSLPIVNFLQAIPPTIAPGTLQGKIILNRDYGKLGDDDYSDPDKTTLLYLNDYHEEYFKEITGFSYWGGGAGFQNATYSPTYENFVWSHDGKLLAFPVVHTGVQLFILDTSYLHTDIEAGLQKITLSPYTLYDTSPNGFIRHISWAPNNQQIIVDVAIPKFKGPCIIDVPTEEIRCGIFPLLLFPSTQEEQEVISLAKAITWSPIDKSQMAFILQEDTPTHKAGLYLLDSEKNILRHLWQIPVNTQYTFGPPYPTPPIWYVNGERILFSPEKNVFASVDTNGKDYQLLFDNRILYQQIAGLVPKEYQETLPDIYSPSWSPDGNYVIFEVHWRTDWKKSLYLLRGIFLFEKETNKIFLLRDFISTRLIPFNGPFLKPSWAP